MLNKVASCGNHYGNYYQLTSFYSNSQDGRLDWQTKADQSEETRVLGERPE